MAIINFSKKGQTNFEKLLGHIPKLMKNWNLLSDCLEKEGHLSAQLKEEIRRMLAQQNGCLYCKAKGKPQNNMRDEKSIVCIGATEVFLKCGDQIPKNVMNVIKESLTEEEIVELFAFITFTNCQQQFGAIMNLEPG